MASAFSELPVTDASRLPRAFLWRRQLACRGWGRLIPLLVFLGFLAFTPLSYAQETARVKRVVDGDTVRLEDGRWVRYLGINTPEFGEPYSRRARELNAALVRGREVRLEFDQESADSYARILAYVHVGQDMVNARLVREGLAHAFFIGTGQRHNDLFLRLQEEAKTQRLGIWSRQGRLKELKITSVHPPDPAAPDPQQAYVRVACLASSRVSLGGYVLENDAGRQFRFPAVTLDPGYTVLVVHAEGPDGIDARGQLVVHWPGGPSPWSAAGGTSYLRSAGGRLVDTFRYRGRHG
jgi:micrococcal nuclease